MQKSDFYEMSRTERLEALDTNCEKVSEGYIYSKPLSEDEIKDMNSEINQALHEIERRKEERKELTTAIAEKTKIVVKNNQEVVRGYTEVCEKIWTVNNYESGFAEKINADGFVIEKTRFEQGDSMNLFNKNKKIS